MTLGGCPVVDEVVVAEPEGEGGGEYVRLWQSCECECVCVCEEEVVVSVSVKKKKKKKTAECKLGRSLFWWFKLVLVVACLLVAAAAFLLWGLPFLLNKVVLPILDWERTSFTNPVLALIVFASIALFPTLLIPSSPSMWVAGMTFGYGYGFLLIMAAASVGMSLPFAIGSLFHHKLHYWLENWPKQAAVVRLAGEGDWFHQFRAVALIRISPFPYIVFNYASVATNVNYCPYILGSIAGIVPEIFITIYSGILIRNLADASDGRRFLSLEQIIYDVIGFCIALSATIVVTAYAKKTLQNLQTEDELA